MPTPYSSCVNVRVSPHGAVSRRGFLRASAGAILGLRWLEGMTAFADELRKDGRSCGAAPVEMVSMIPDMRWQLDRNPREASFVATARWDLDVCRVEVFDR